MGHKQAETMRRTHQHLIPHDSYIFTGKAFTTSIMDLLPVGSYLASISAFSRTACAMVSASWYFFLLFITSLMESCSSAWTAISWSVHWWRWNKHHRSAVALLTILMYRRGERERTMSMWRWLFAASTMRTRTGPLIKPFPSTSCSVYCSAYQEDQDKAFLWSSANTHDNGNKTLIVMWWKRS